MCSQQRPHVKEAVRVAGVGRRHVECPDLRREHGDDALARGNGSGDAEYAGTPADPGDACVSQHGGERAVKHLHANSWIPGHSHRGRVVAKRSGSDPGGSADLIPTFQPSDLEVRHVLVLSERPGSFPDGGSPSGSGTGTGGKHDRTHTRAAERRADPQISRGLGATQDFKSIIDSFTEDAVYHSIPLAPIIGKPAIAEFVAGFADVPPGRLEIHHQLASDTIVMNERTDRIVINGRPVTLPICGVFEEIEGARIKARWHEYFDLGPAKAAYGHPQS